MVVRQYIVHISRYQVGPIIFYDRLANPLIKLEKIVIRYSLTHSFKQITYHSSTTECIKNRMEFIVSHALI